MKAELDAIDERFRVPRWSRVLALVLFCVCVALALGNQFRLLDYLEWGDESETIVAARMLASGMSLYSQVFNHHGPLTFLPGWLLERLGHFGVRGYRVFIAALQIAALYSLYTSPLLKHANVKRLVMPLAVTAAVLLLPKSELHGQTYTYQVLAGLLLMAVLAQYTLPSMVRPESIRRRHVIWGNAGLACLPWLAVTYAPVALLLFFGSLRRNRWGAAMTGVVLATVLNLVFLGVIGSFAGFLADHIYLNSQILPRYNGGQGWAQLLKAVVLLPSDNITLGFAIIGLAGALASLSDRTAQRSGWRLALLGVALATLLIRGLVHQGAPFWYAAITLATVAATTALANELLTRRQQALWLAGSAFCAVQLAYPLVSRGAYEAGRRAEATEFGWLAQRLSEPADKVIAYSFRNFEYLAADRLPASGDFFYLPWQAAYNERPKYGVAVDACRQIGAYRPKLMLLDKWTVWGRYSWESYAGCIQTIVDRQYTQLPGRPIYVRNDLFELAVRLKVPAELQRDSGQ